MGRKLSACGVARKKKCSRVLCIISHSLKLPVKNVSIQLRRLRYPVKIAENNFLRQRLQDFESEQGCQIAQLESAAEALQDAEEG